MRQIKKICNNIMIVIIFISVISINLLPVNVYADAAVGRLTDVKESDWYFDTLNNAISNGIISGYPDGTFKPQNNITRAEFTKMLLNSLNIYISEGYSFQDVEGHWAEHLIYTAWSKGIIRKADFGAKEYDDEVNYYPDEEINRIEMSRMAVRAAGLEKEAIKRAGQVTEFLDDNEISNEDKGYALIANQNGIINGHSDKTFKPNGKATRAEATQILVNTINTIVRLKIEKQNETQDDIIARVNERLKNRDVEIKLPKGVESAAVHKNPQTYEELIENVQSLKAYSYTNKKSTWKMLDISQVVSNNDYDEFVETYVGVVKMDTPSSGFKLSTSVYEGKTYDILYSDTLKKDGFGTGRLIKGGEVIGRVNETSGYYGVGLAEEGNIFTADYIGFTRYANDFILSYKDYDNVLIIFENPFKK